MLRKIVCRLRRHPGPYFASAQVSGDTIRVVVECANCEKILSDTTRTEPNVEAKVRAEIHALHRLAHPDEFADPEAKVQ